MKKRTWLILGATSIIAEKFAHLAAEKGYSLLLIGRHLAELAIIATDIRIRYGVPCEIFFTDFSVDCTALLTLMKESAEEFDFFIAHSLVYENSALTPEKINELVRVNIISTSVLIDAYMARKQTEHRLIFLSSVAANRGRTKNSLYGGSKAAIETYLSGLQQNALDNQHLLIAKLGFIDTHQTYGLPGIFYASPPKACAKACWQASYAGKRLIYHPNFWRFIMAIISHLPFFIYRRLRV